MKFEVENSEFGVRSLNPLTLPSPTGERDEVRN